MPPRSGKDLSMRYLILGQGGREHAIVRALKFSPTVTEIHAAPGSRGISQEAICHDVDLGDAAAVEVFVKRYRFDVVICGAEAAGDGLAERLRALNIAVVGGPRSMPIFQSSHDRSRGDVTVLVLTNGERYEAVPLTRSVSERCVVAPADFDEALRARLRAEILEPAMTQIRASGDVVRDLLRIEVKLSDGVPRAIGYGCGFGDQDAQVLLPLLEGDWGRVFFDLACGRLTPLRWASSHTACVVATASGYPDAPITGAVIDGDLGYQTATSYFLHAGTSKSKSGQWIVNGSEVIDAVGIGQSAEEALEAATNQMARVDFKGAGKHRV
jgi:phosphoribosylamine-glycine ligase